MKTNTYRPTAGEHIEHACQEAVRLAMKSGESIAFTFNEIPLVATPESLSVSLVQEFHRECNRRSEEYANSPQGKAAANARQAEISNLNAKATYLLSTIGSVLAGRSLDALMGWFAEFIPAADDISVRFDTRALADKLEASGFKENEYVGQKPEWFDQGGSDARIRTGRYIVGQIINCLRRGMPPHPVAISFIEQYQKLPPSPEAN